MAVASAVEGRTSKYEIGKPEPAALTSELAHLFYYLQLEPSTAVALAGTGRPE